MREGRSEHAGRQGEVRSDPMHLLELALLGKKAAIDELRERVRLVAFVALHQLAESHVSSREVHFGDVSSARLPAAHATSPRAATAVAVEHQRKASKPDSTVS